MVCTSRRGNLSFFIIFLEILNTDFGQFLRSQSLSVLDGEHLFDEGFDSIANHHIAGESKNTVVNKGH